jgi:hypothetical protein
MDGSRVSPHFELIGFAEELGHLENLVDLSDPEASESSLSRLLQALRISDVAMAALHDAAADKIAEAVLPRFDVTPGPPTVAYSRVRSLDMALARLGQRRR